MLDAKTKKRVASLKRELEKVRADLARDRDRLNQLLQEYEDIRDNADEAFETLDYSIDKLSELV